MNTTLIMITSAIAIISFYLAVSVSSSTLIITIPDIMVDFVRQILDT